MHIDIDIVTKRAINPTCKSLSKWSGNTVPGSCREEKEFYYQLQTIMREEGWICEREN